MNRFEMQDQHREALNVAEGIVATAERGGNRAMTASEQVNYDAAMATAAALVPQIAAATAKNTLASLCNRGGFFNAAARATASDPAERAWDRPVGPAHSAFGIHGTTPVEHPKAAEFRNQFAGWMNGTLRALGGGTPQMEAVAPTGPISIGDSSGWDSVGITVPTEILPYLPSYFNLDSFALAGASQIFTPHSRPLVKPIISAGAADAVFAENAAPTTSQPFGISAFTFGGVKYARLVLASYEALMNSELPLQGVILDELLSSLATTLTTATTTAFVAALVAAASTLAVGVGGSGGSVYTSMIDLRHAIPPRFDLPSNVFMLSRATLALVRNTRASTSGVPMFSPDGGKLFDRNFVINDNLDTATGAGVGFVAFGSFADGAFLRRTPVDVRVFLEAFASQGNTGYRVQQWCDAHFLAELAGAAQPPTFQPIFYSNVTLES